MKTVFTCPEFTIDLTAKALNWTEENSWFSDEVILSSTFPFELDFDEDPFFEKFRHFNDTKPKTRFDGTLLKPNGTLTPARLDIEEAMNKLTGTIRAGIELFPSWEKQLSEIDMGRTPDSDPYAYAESIINQSWPDVSHNFPMVECWELYKEEPQFYDFLGYYNRRGASSGFQQNQENVEENRYYNFNIVYPFVYYLHILKCGIEAGGYTLHGDILEDEQLKMAAMAPKKIDFLPNPETMDFNLGYPDITGSSGKRKFYEAAIELQENTKYKIKGIIKTQPAFLSVIEDFKFYYNDVIISSVNVTFQSGLFHFEIIIPSGAGGTFKAKATYFMWADYFEDVMESEIIPQAVYDSEGDPVSFLADFQNVNLSENLPEITFGEFVKIIRKWRNYDFTVRPGKEIWMNRVENQMTHDDAVDLSKFDKLIPHRKVQTETSFLLKYSFEHDDFPFTETFVSLDEIISGEDLKVSEETTLIDFDALPLPVLQSELPEHRYVQKAVTAKMITDDVSKVTLVLYAGLTDGRNFTLPPDAFTTPALLQECYYKFLMFRLKSIEFIWTAKDHKSEFLKLEKDSKVFAYNNYLIVKSLNRKQKDLFEEVEITARSF